MILFRRAAGFLGICAGLLVLAAVGGGLWLQGERGHAWLVTTAAALARSSGQDLTIGAIEGSVPFDMTVRDVVVADRTGAFLRLDRLHLWVEPAALLRGRLVVGALELGRLAVERPPAPAQTAVVAPAAAPAGDPLDQLRRFRLPLAIEVRRLAVDELRLGAALLGGSPAALRLNGALAIGGADGSHSLELHAARIDGGRTTADIALAFAPEQDRLDAEMVFAEPAGGMVGGLLDLPGRPPLEATLKGSGKLSDWRGRLIAAAGTLGRLTAEARVRNAEGGWNLTLDAGGDPSGWLAPPWARLVGHVPSLGIDARIDAKGHFGLSRGDLVLAAGSLEASGTLSRPDDRLALQFDLTRLNAAAFGDLLPGVGWQSLTAQGRAEGRALAPSLTLDIAGKTLSAGALKSREVTLRLGATPKPARGSSPPGFALDLDARALGLSGDDPAVARLAGPSLRLAAQAKAEPVGQRLVVERLTLSGTGGTLLAASGHAAKSGAGLDAAATLEAAELARIAGAFGLPLSGTVRADATVTGGPSGLTARLDAVASRLGSGDPALDGVLAQGARLSGSLAVDPAGAVSLSALRLRAAGATLSGGASLVAEKIEGAFDLALPDLAPLVRPFGQAAGGSLAAHASLSGTLDHFAVKAKASSAGLQIAERRFGAIELSTETGGLPAAPHGTAKARIEGLGPVWQASAGFALDHGALAISDLVVGGGGNRLAGTLRLAADGASATGRLRAESPDLASLTAVVGQELRGRVTADLGLDAKPGHQAVQVTIAGDGVGLSGDAPLSVRRSDLSLSLDAPDLPGLGGPAARLKASAELKGVSAGAAAVDSLGFTAEGSLRQTAFRLRAAGGGVQPASLDLAGSFGLAETGQRLRLESLRGGYGGETVTLSQAATLDLAPDRVALAGLRLDNGPARLTADGSLDHGSLSGRLRLDKLPLALARLADPSLRLAGRADVELSLSGRLDDPAGDLVVRVNGLGVPEMVRAGVAGIDAETRARWRNGSVALSGKAKAGTGLDLALEGSVPLTLAGGPPVPPQGRVAARVTGAIDLARLNDLLAASGDRMAGRLTIDLTAGGTVAAPKLGGTATLADGRYENFVGGTVISEIDARLTGVGDALTIERFAGKTSNGGTISASGQVHLAGDGPLDLRLTAENARLAQIDAATADVDAALKVTGTIRDVRVDGTVTVRKADLRLPDRLPPQVVDLEVREVGSRTAALAAERGAAHRNGRLPLPQRKPAVLRTARAEAAPGADTPGAQLEVKLATGSQVYVRGRGLDLQLGGDLAVAGPADRPLVTGKLKLVRGSLSFLGKEFAFQKVDVTFPGDATVDPILDLEAEARATGIVAVVQITGRASAPKLELTSTPVLPQDEVLARILFDKPVSQLGGVEAAQLAQSASQLIGLGGSVGLLDQVRRTLGVDRLQLVGGQDGKGGGLEAGQYLGQDVYVGVQQGIGAGSSQAKVEIDLTETIQIEAGVPLGGSTQPRVGLKFEWDY